ncbi:MAG: hypothetical protein ABR507_07135 [Actinomycetota bacterium]|nr:hypothetical protein [Actinomycetota bacterium]
MKTNRDRLARSIIGLALVSALVAGISGASASSGTSTIQVGHPGTFLAGITEGDFWLARNCSGIQASTQGVDGIVIDLSGANTLSVSGASPAPGGIATPFSINIHFYGNGCHPINGTGAPQSGPQKLDIHSWTGAIPKDAFGANARWAVVSVYLGAQVSITYNAYTV